MNVLVTGATGFLGQGLCARLEELGARVTRLSSRNCDLTRSYALRAWEEVAYDRIFHLAAWAQAGDFCLHHAGEQWIINQQINTHVLAWWQKRQPQAKLVCIGTSCAYDPALELAEENYLAGRPIDSLLAYALTKRMLYAGLLALNRQYGLRYLHVVPSTLYGPGYPTDGRQMHFIFDLIRKILRGRFHGEEVVLWGDGYQMRELVLVDDFVDLLLRLEEVCENESVNVGAGEEHTIRHFARLICEQVGYDFRLIRFDPSRHVGARSKCLVVKKLHGLVPDCGLTPLKAGLAQTIDWFMNQKERFLSLSA